MEILDQQEDEALPSKWWRALGIVRMPVAGIVAIGTLVTFYQLYIIEITSHIANNEASFNFGRLMGQLIFTVLIFFFCRYHILQGIQEIKISSRIYQKRRSRLFSLIILLIFLAIFSFTLYNNGLAYFDFYSFGRLAITSIPPIIIVIMDFHLLLNSKVLEKN